MMDESGEAKVELTEEEIEQQKRLEDAVHQAIASEESIVKNAHKYIEADTLSEKISDAITYFSGSWFFIIGLGLFISCWMLFMRRFDEYPFILLNLIISVICVLQSPFILQNQWRKESKDGDRDDQEYAINLKAELQTRTILEQQELILEMLKKQQEDIKAIKDKNP